MRTVSDISVTLTRKVTGWKLDGCTCAPEFIFHDCCNQHDVDYLERAMTRREADVRFLECMLRESRGRLFWIGMAWVYYGAVRVFGRFYWRG